MTAGEIFAAAVADAASICTLYDADATPRGIAEVERQLARVLAMRDALHDRGEALLHDALRSLIQGAGEAIHRMANTAADTCLPSGDAIRCLAAAVVGDVEEAQAAFKAAARDIDSPACLDVLKFALAGAEAERMIDGDDQPVLQ